MKSSQLSKSAVVSKSFTSVGPCCPGHSIRRQRPIKPGVVVDIVASSRFNRLLYRANMSAACSRCTACTSGGRARNPPPPPPRWSARMALNPIPRVAETASGIDGYRTCENLHFVFSRNSLVERKSDLSCTRPDCPNACGIPLVA